MWDLSGVTSSQMWLQPVVPSLRGTGINYFCEIPRECWVFSPSLFFFSSYSKPPSSLPFSPQIPKIPIPGCGDATMEQQTLSLAPRGMIHIHNSLSSTKSGVVTSKWLPRSSPMPGHCPGWGVPKPCWWPHGLGGVGLVPCLMTESGSGLSIGDFAGGVNHWRLTPSCLMSLQADGAEISLGILEAEGM